MSRLSVQMQAKQEVIYNRVTMDEKYKLSRMQFNVLRVLLEYQHSKLAGLTCSVDISRKIPLLNVLRPHTCPIKHLPATEMNFLVEQGMVTAEHLKDGAVCFTITREGGDALMNNIATGIINSINPVELNILVFVCDYNVKQRKMYGNNSTYKLHFGRINRAIKTYCKFADVVAGVRRLAKHRILFPIVSDDEDFGHYDEQAASYALSHSSLAKVMSKMITRQSVPYEFVAPETDIESNSIEILAIGALTALKHPNSYTHS